MACMGPSHDEAVRRGTKLAEAILKLLEAQGIKKYPQPLPGWERQHHKRFDELAEKLKQDVIELVWEVDSATF